MKASNFSGAPDGPTRSGIRFVFAVNDCDGKNVCQTLLIQKFLGVTFGIFCRELFNYGPSPLLQVEYTLGLGGQQLEVKMYSAFCFSIFLSFLVVVLFK